MRALGEAARGTRGTSGGACRGGGDPGVERLAEFAEMLDRGGLRRALHWRRGGRPAVELELDPAMWSPPQPAPRVELLIARPGSLGQPDEQSGEGGDGAAGEQHVARPGV